MTELADGWRFRFGEGNDAASDPAFDDTGWEQVSVPHSWNLIGEYALERSEKTNNAQGVGWYRLTMQAPAAAPGMRQYLDFAAVGNIADVWVNGGKVCQHRGAFSRFRCDVTDMWKPGEPNSIAVRADNSKRTPDSRTGQVIPLAGDFFIHGGIYRGVSLVQLPAASIDPLDHGGPGVYIRTAQVTDKKAVVDIRTRLRNFGEPRALSLRSEVRDAEGKVVAASEHSFTLASGVQDEPARVSFMNPRLWDGLTDPYLYSVTVRLSDGGTVLDEVTQPLGIRTFRFDADAGFFLNGKRVKLHGVSRHQDYLGKGWALSREDHARDMEFIKELGANTVRHAHYQHADEWSDEADKAGMVVWAELPYVGAPSLTGGKGTPELWANAEQQLRELIRQNYNHPSIMMWSIGNEVDSAKAFGATEETASPIDLLRRMEEVAKEEDTSRPTTFADFSEDMGYFGKNRQPMTGVADLVAYNRYPGWYYNKGPGAGRVLGGMLDMHHAKNPTVPIGVSEYGAGAGLSQFSDDPTSGFVASAGRPQPDEYAAYVHEMLWPAIAERDYIHGSWVWNMFDFVSDLRNEGDSVDINTKGLVSMDRKVKKDGFFYYKAAWSKQPTVHLAGKRYVDRSYPVMDVKAYTNASTARLTFNGADLGEKTCVNYTCVWQDVNLKAGENNALVVAGGKTDSAIWDGIAAEINGIRIDSGNLAASKLNGKRYGSDTFVSGGEAIARFGGSIGPLSTENIPVAAESPELFDHWRSGEAFSYSIPVTDGNWTVAIRTLEPGESKPDARQMLIGVEAPPYKPVIMSVSAGDKIVIGSLNAASEAGARRKEVVRSFPVLVTGGILKLDFSGVDGGKAIVAAIEVTK
ncbi:MAG: glycoside hydrolase family 2 TIM barrel-domain containing protein [Sphingomonadaceae bacterium]